MSAERPSFLSKIRHVFVPSRHNQYHPHVFARTGLIAFLAVALAAEGFLVAVVVSQQSGGNFLAAVEEGAVIALTNAQRKSDSLGSLTENKLLDQAAQTKADDMAAKGYFAHVTPDGRQPWDFIAAAGYDYEYAGENLAVRFTDSKDVVNAWMASPTHRENILKPQYRDIGIGIAQGTYQGQPATFVVQMFGTTPEEDSVVAGAPAWSGGQVLGASIELPHISPSLMQRLQAYFNDMLGSPRELVLAALTTLAVVVFCGVGITLFAHGTSRRAPKAGLMFALMIGITALSFAAFDSEYFGAQVTVSQTAAATNAVAP